MITRKYCTIYADPAWDETGGGKIPRGADAHYSVMKLDDILALSGFVKSISDDNSHLYLWATNNHLPEAIQVMYAWGFRYVTCITWVKNNIGLGQYFRGVSEHCLFGVKGMLPYKEVRGARMQGVTAFIAPKGEHSSKPDKMRRMIEKVSYPPYIELFARTKVSGWDSWGYQIYKEPNNRKEIIYGNREISNNQSKI